MGFLFFFYLLIGLFLVMEASIEEYKKGSFDRIFRKWSKEYSRFGFAALFFAVCLILIISWPAVAFVRGCTRLYNYISKEEEES